VFNGRIAFILSLCGGAVLFLGVRLSQCSDTERQAVQQLVEQTSASMQPGTSTQQRFEVRRDVYAHAPTTQRSHLRVFGETADLDVDWSTGLTTERMTVLQGLIEQEGVPLRTFNADSGEFVQTEQRLYAHGVQFSERSLDQTTRSGKAEELVVCTDHQPFHFEATEFSVESAGNAATLQAHEAKYQENQLRLYGQARITLSSVDMAAEHIRVEPATSQAESIYLEGNVYIQLPNGARISCATADLDLVHGIGRFSAVNEEVHLVMKREKGGDIQLTAKELTLRAESDSVESWQVYEVTASGNVHVEESSGWDILADTLEFHELEGGQLHLSSCGSAPCRVKKEGVGHLTAHSIHLNRDKQHAHAVEASGSLLDSHHQKIQFQGQEIFWSQSSRNITMVHQVMVQQEDGRLETDDRLDLSYNENQEPQHLTITGNIHMESAIPARTISCPGTCEVDFPNSRTHLVATQQGKQVRFHEGATRLATDELFIAYNSEDGRRQPQHLQANGRVRVQNHYGLSVGSDATQYALADHLAAWPTEHRLELFSDHPTRVLLLDSGNGLAISAPKVLLHPDSNGKERVRGVGDVRMTLLEKEYQQLKQRFHLKEKQQS